MLLVVAIVILYVAGFVFLYGVIRLAVRNALEDLEARRAQLMHAEQRALAEQRTLLRENAYLAGG